MKFLGYMNILLLACFATINADRIVKRDVGLSAPSRTYLPSGLTPSQFGNSGGEVEVFDRSSLPRNFNSFPQNFGFQQQHNSNFGGSQTHGLSSPNLSQYLPPYTQGFQGQNGHSSQYNSFPAASNFNQGFTSSNHQFPGNSNLGYNGFSTNGEHQQNYNAFHPGNGYNNYQASSRYSGGNGHSAQGAQFGGQNYASNGGYVY